MGFNDVGSYTISPGAVVGVTYRFSDDQGAQFAMAQTKTAHTVLYVFGQSKERTAAQFEYSLQVRNDSSIESSFALQGGFAHGFNNSENVLTLEPGQQQNSTHQFGIGLDEGSQFFGADVKTLGTELVAFDQGKEVTSAQGVVYSSTIKNNGFAAAAYNFQGGGSANGFNNFGDTGTVEPGQVVDYSFHFVNRDTLFADHGAQYATPDVQTKDVLLVAVEHGKELVGIVNVLYHVKIRNDGTVTGAYNVQGGGLQ